VQGAQKMEQGVVQGQLRQPCPPAQSTEVLPACSLVILETAPCYRLGAELRASDCLPKATWHLTPKAEPFPPRDLPEPHTGPSQRTCLVPEIHWKSSFAPSWLALQSSLPGELHKMSLHVET
jgi:hypothetical protein